MIIQEDLTPEDLRLLVENLDENSRSDDAASSTKLSLDPRNHSSSSTQLSEIPSSQDVDAASSSVSKSRSDGPNAPSFKRPSVKQSGLSQPSSKAEPKFPKVRK